MIKKAIGMNFILTLLLFTPSFEAKAKFFSKLAAIRSIASHSKCASINWEARGFAHRGYIEGMALMFARAVCHKNKISAQLVLGPEAKDALTYYKREGSIINTYALLIGLGMRESSGEYCTGQDRSSPKDQTSERAEAGLFQSSYDAIASSPEPIKSEMISLFEDYKHNRKKCFLKTFSKKISCKPFDALNWGSGEGAIFQKLSKDCPGFATEFAALNIRVDKGHYGTLNKSQGKYQAEFKDECAAMLSDVEKVVNSTQQVCKEL